MEIDGSGALVHLVVPCFDGEARLSLKCFRPGVRAGGLDIIALPVGSDVELLAIRRGLDRSGPE